MAKAAATKIDWRTLIEAKPETKPEIIEALDKYFEAFAQPELKQQDGKTIIADQTCIQCDEPLTGMIALIGRGGFTWGLAHGEGHCANCRWPARAHHFIKDADGETLLTLRNFVLQYHPDHVTIDEQKSA